MQNPIRTLGPIAGIVLLGALVAGLVFASQERSTNEAAIETPVVDEVLTPATETQLDTATPADLETATFALG